ncbi:hypothetical protein GQ37_014360 [Janthinobacterium sp. BJB1]|nr:hypothetical protein CSQ90_27195 [Janthinobacterium sp. BJB303]PJC98232.1 hypothetical protein GQ37_014360 [Janthinobacterium sp. BJB1]
MLAGFAYPLRYSASFGGIRWPWNTFFPKNQGHCLYGLKLAIEEVELFTDRLLFLMPVKR